METKSALSTKERREQTGRLATVLRKLTPAQKQKLVEFMATDSSINSVSRPTLDRIARGDVEAVQGTNIAALWEGLKSIGITDAIIADSELDDGLPRDFAYEYEKEIVEEFFAHGKLDSEYLSPDEMVKWPDVESSNLALNKENPIPETAIGKHRPRDARISVEARTAFRKSEDDKFLTFLEAGPRKEICFPIEHSLRVGILVSGGIAPGTNSIIHGIVERHELYLQQYLIKHTRKSAYHLDITGYQDGLGGLVRPRPATKKLKGSETRLASDTAGSIIGTSRHMLLEHGQDPGKRRDELEKVVLRLSNDLLDIVYIIGGDGTMKAAHAIYRIAKEMRKIGKIKSFPSIVAIPKTMDNDVLWVWQSIGFQAAVAKATEFVKQMHVEAKSNPRLCIVQLYGSDSGFMVSHAALASGVCDAALIPEVKFSMRKLSEHIKDILRNRFDSGESAHALIVAAETSIPTDVEDYLDDKDVGLSDDEKRAIRNFQHPGEGQVFGRVHGQTSDFLRCGGLKVISRVLQRDLNSTNDEYWSGFRVFTNEPRHLLRAIPPTGAEIIFGQRLGALAVDTAMAGYTDCMISQWLTEYVVVPLSLVVLGRKRVPPKGFFWRTVLSSTNQPESLE